jgi:hypothetical protein
MPKQQATSSDSVSDRPPLTTNQERTTMDATQTHVEMKATLTAIQPRPLRRFDTREELLEGYAIYLHLNDSSSELEFARIAAKSSWTYQPHLYCGGYVIPGFGYSTERIGIYISAESAGYPELVKRTR